MRPPATKCSTRTHLGRAPRRPSAAWLALGLALGWVAGCRARPDNHHEEKAPGKLTVRVEPAVGVSILVDGVRVADHAPYHNPTLAPGNHVLEVRGMGRYPVALPFVLPAGGELDVPVVLRPRAPLPFDERAPSEPSGAARAAANLGANSGAKSADAAVAAPGRVRPSLGQRGSAPLPPGATPLRLAVAPTPPAAIVADGTEMPGADVRLGYGQGLLQVGEMRLAYRVFPGRALELTVPHEDVPWFLGEQQVKAKSLVRVSGTAVVLRRGSGPTQQQVWLRRLE